MVICIDILFLFVVGNFAHSLRLAYTMARDLSDGGYPILGHVVHNSIALFFAMSLSMQVFVIPIPMRWVLIVAVYTIPALNVWLIIRCRRAGERCRAKLEGINKGASPISLPNQPKIDL